MSASLLKLTSYFDERDRAARGGLLAGRLLALYGERNVRMSLLLRGSEGFGHLHHLHSDRQLTMSDDLPVVSIAVDEPERIKALVPDVLALQRGGVLTLERAGLTVPEGDVKLSVYVARRARVGTIVAELRRCGMAGATVLMGVDGTLRGRRSRARLLHHNAGVPAIIVAVGSGPSVARAIDRLDEPLYTLERVRVCRRDGIALAGAHELPAGDPDGRRLWQKLTVYSSAADRLVRSLLGAGAAGATSVRGVWGFHGDHSPHGDRLLQIRRRVPVVTTVIDRPERISGVFGAIEDVTRRRGLVTSEMVPALVAGDGDLLL